MGIILSCFKGIGKTYLENTKGRDVKISDLSDFDGDYSTFVDNVLSEAADNDIVFVPSDKTVRDLLNERGVNYDVFYPSKERRKEFIENEVRKHSKSSEIRLLDTNFNQMIDEIEEDDSENCYKHVLSGFGEFIGNNPILLSYIDDISKKKIKNE